MFPSKLKHNNRSSSNLNYKPISHKKIDDEDIIYKKYEIGRKLGQGSFGVVYEIDNKETNEKFAIKIINKEKVGGGKYNVSFENEVFIMKSVIHPNLIKLEEVFESKKKLYLITELCEAGELAKWIKKQGPIPEHISKIIMRQIVDAISYLHKNDIVHRDLKLENILLKEFDPSTDNYYIKVTDFGLSSQRETAGTESMFEDYCGTPLYMAPEIIENLPYSQLCDVWALGIIMFILLTSHSPFTSKTESDLREQIKRAEIDIFSKDYVRLSPEAKHCLQRMIKVNPAHRITSSELFEHPWFLDKKLDEMPETKNVLELMTEMLQEQDSYENNSAINTYTYNSHSKYNNNNSEPTNGDDQETEIVNENKVPNLKFQSKSSPNSKCNGNRYETPNTTRQTDRSEKRNTNAYNRNKK